MFGSAKRKEEKQVQPLKLVWKVLPPHLSKETGSFMEDLSTNQTKVRYAQGDAAGN